MSATVDDVPIADVDSHVAEPLDLWTARLPAKLGDAIPHVVWDESAGESRWKVGDVLLSAVGEYCSAGRGTVYTYTVLHAGPSAGFPVPSVLAIVDVDEGYPMLSSVVGCPPADVRIGMRVDVSFEELTDEINLPVFRPADREDNA